MPPGDEYSTGDLPTAALNGAETLAALTWRTRQFRGAPRRHRLSQPRNAAFGPVRGQRTNAAVLAQLKRTKTFSMALANESHPLPDLTQQRSISKSAKGLTAHPREQSWSHGYAPRCAPSPAPTTAPRQLQEPESVRGDNQAPGDEG